MKKLFSTFTFFAIASAVMYASIPAHAAPAGFYFNPASGSVIEGKTFSTQLIIGSSSNTEIKAHFSYNPSRLIIIDYSTQGSPFASTIQYDNTSGEATISGSGTGSGDRMIASFTFQAVTPGAAALTFSGTNQTGSNLLNLGLLGTNWTNSSTTNAAYMVIAATSSEQPTLPPATSGTATPSSGSSSLPRASQPPDSRLQPAPPSIGQQKQSPHVESHQEEIISSDSRVTGFAVPDEQTVPSSPSRSLPLGLGVAALSTLLAAIGMFFAYRGYRIHHLMAWYQHMSTLALAKPASSSPLAHPAITHIATTLKLITYHPMKLLESGNYHTTTKVPAPFVKRRTLR